MFLIDNCLHYNLRIDNDFATCTLKIYISGYWKWYKGKKFDQNIDCILI